MKLLVYEWCTSGGLDAPGGSALAAEGRLMARAVAVDAARVAGLEVEVLVAVDAPLDLPAGVTARAVPSGGELLMLTAGSSAADWTLVIAPETDGILADRVARCRATGGRVLAGSGSFIDLAGDKQATGNALAAAGLPVPAGTVRPAHASWPAGFRRPAMRKPRGGVGAEHCFSVWPGDACPSPVAHDERIEAFGAGLSVGAACICGGQTVLPLPPLEQQFEDLPGGGIGYAGGRPVADRATGGRARALAAGAVRAIANAAGTGLPTGWVGVDMILGERADGRDDRVLEVNPRLTTSFVSLAAGATVSLVQLMIAAASGQPVAATVDCCSPRSFRVATHDPILATAVGGHRG
jgi:predicted ATP-grasp superfamily ATP-dependent carboligase